LRHIALITTSYPDGTPGSEAAGSFVADFALELSMHARVTVLAASSENAVEADGNLTVVRFAVQRLPLSLLNPLRPDHWGPILHTLRAGRNALEQLVQQARPDHVLALWALPGGYWAERTATRHQLGYSVWALGSDIWGLGRIPLIRQVLKRVLIRADARYADGFLLARDVEKLCGLTCEFLPSTRRLQRAAGPKTSSRAPYKLAFLGRWHPNKGVDLLLDALSRLNDADWSGISSLRVCGGGPLHDAVHNSVQELRAIGRPISVEGYMDKDAAADLICWADYLLLPSRIESIPVIFSDAVQLRTPIVSTPVGDMPRLHDKYHFGIVATEVSADAYAEALRSALQTSATAFDASLLSASKDFDLTAIAQRFLSATFEN
jgi:glycosyltransferase involved in cell wall biosynthesis